MIATSPHLQSEVIKYIGYILLKRLKATREALGLTQEQVIEQLENSYSVVISQQTLSYIENGKRKVDAERELPAFAGVYNKSIDYFYETLELAATPVPPTPKRRSVVIDMEALTNRDKLEIAVELINNVLQET